MSQKRRARQLFYLYLALFVANALMFWLLWGGTPDQSAASTPHYILGIICLVGLVILAVAVCFMGWAAFWHRDA